MSSAGLGVEKGNEVLIRKERKTKEKTKRKKEKIYE